MKKAVAAAAFLVTQGACAFTGNQLYEIMRDQDPSGRIAAMAYVRGFVDASHFSALTYKIKDGRQVSGQYFCMPEGATLDQAKDLIQAELVAQVASRHLPASVLAYGALSKAWPCR